MAIFKPESTSSFTDYLGVCEIALVDFKDKSKDFDWADIFIEVEMAIKDSEYPRHIRIRGSFDKDEKGAITGGSVLNRMYKFFEDIGCTAGVNLKGKWESEDGKVIKDMAKYLNDNHTDKLHSHPYYGYVYKELNKKSQKAYFYTSLIFTSKNMKSRKFYADLSVKSKRRNTHDHIHNSNAYRNFNHGEKNRQTETRLTKETRQ